MKQMGKYCKAYPVTRFREFDGWKENTANLREDRAPAGATDADRRLTEEDFLYLQENFVVTDGIFINENVIFDEVTPEWIEFCKGTLNFEVPVYETVKA